MNSFNSIFGATTEQVTANAVPLSADFTGNLDEIVMTFGDDDRELAGNTDWDQRIAFITAEFPDGGSSGFTGALISPFHILTVAHGIYDKEDGGFVNSNDIQISLGQDGTDRYYGTANAVEYTYFTGYTDDSNWELNDEGEWKPQSFNDDMAIITLDRNIGDHTSWFGYKYNTDDNYFEDLGVNTAGYPSDLADSWSWSDTTVADVDLYHTYGPITDVNNETFEYRLDIAGGQSGSPVWQFTDGERYIVGVHSFGGSSHNGAVRITEGKFNEIQDIIEEQTVLEQPTDLPDFVDYDEWFSTDYAHFTNEESGVKITDASSNTTVDINPGDDFEFRAVIRNNGTSITDDGFYFAQPQINVSFYASSNDFISSSDYELGTVSLDSIAPFEFQDAYLNASLPSNIPEGEYHIGYSFGSIMNEFDTGNNTGIIDGGTIQVGSGYGEDNYEGYGEDNYEGNDSRFDATTLPEGDWLTGVNGAGIANDEDWYEIDINPGYENLEVDLQFDHDGGDIDLEVYNALGDYITGSASASDNESINTILPEPGSYYLKVYPFTNSDAGNNYDLLWDDVAV